MRADKLVFEKQYSDNSGIRFAVRLDNDDVQIEADGHMAELPVMELDWLIGSLLRIRSELQQDA